jgi:hypothetical protein
LARTALTLARPSPMVRARGFSPLMSMSALAAAKTGMECQCSGKAMSTASQQRKDVGLAGADAYGEGPAEAQGLQE